MNHKIDVVAGRYYINLFPKEQKKKKTPTVVPMAMVTT